MLAAWFTYRHTEFLPSAIDRYRQEVQRVIGVLDAALTHRPYLIGERCTIADLAFITWDLMVPGICEEADFMATLSEDFPHWTAWHNRLLERPAVKRALKKKQEALDQAGTGVIPTALGRSSTVGSSIYIGN